MSSDNGFVIDLNRITKREFRAYLVGREEIDDKDLWDCERLYLKVIVSWPFDEEISVEGYENLGLTDSIKVDEAVGAALDQLSKKK
jgi:hypothetical protein